MYGLKEVSRILNSSQEILIDDYSRIVLISDCHRGDGSWTDNFLNNQNIYFGALEYYYKNDYTYIEIGDGDELWENHNFSEILNMYKRIFQLLSKFYNKNRFYFIFGNHDIVKKDKDFVKKHLYKYFNENEKQWIPLFPNIKIHEGLVLKYIPTKDKILLIHGHQVDFLNSRLWRLSRFLVRFLWKSLESFGIKDPASPAKNYKKKAKVERSLTSWAKQEKQMIITGHTHRPMFPKVGEPLYFNDGSCVHPDGITAIEISNGHISLVKWYINTREDRSLFIDKEILGGPKKLRDYFSSLYNY
jgi:UDP-2,3-diacylglucosamine pyrophosphatase LpxH